MPTKKIFKSLKSLNNHIKNHQLRDNIRVFYAFQDKDNNFVKGCIDSLEKDIRDKYPDFNLEDDEYIDLFDYITYRSIKQLENYLKYDLQFSGKDTIKEVIKRVIHYLVNEEWDRN